MSVLYYKCSKGYIQNSIKYKSEIRRIKSLFDNIKFQIKDSEDISIWILKFTNFFNETKTTYDEKIIELSKKIENQIEENMILNRKKDVEELTGFLMSKNLEAENSFLKIKNEILEKEKINVVDKKIQLQSKYDKLDGKHCELLNENTILMIDYSDTFFENNNLKEIIFNNNTLINKLENTINDLITEQNRLHNIFKKNILSDDIKNELNKEIQNLSDQLLSYKTKLEKYNQKKKKYIIKTNELILENRELISINEDYNKTLSKLSLETANLTNLKKRSRNTK